MRVEQALWRAGSGLSGAAGRDACHRGKGWAPNGTYSFVQHNRRKAPLINGWVFELQPMACRNGTVRQMMFIHSEQNSNNTQCKNKKGDDPCRFRGAEGQPLPVMGLHQDGARRPQAADPPLPSLLQGRGALPDQEGAGPGQELTQVHDLGRGRLAAIVVPSGFGQNPVGSGRIWDTYV